MGEISRRISLVGKVPFSRNISWKLHFFVLNKVPVPLLLVCKLGYRG